MITTYRLNTQELDIKFFKAFKTLFKDKNVKITVEEDIPKIPINQKELWERMEAVKKKYPPFIVSPDIDLSELANEVNL